MRLIILLCLLLSVGYAQDLSDDIRITPEATLALLKKGEKVLILDVRSESHYRSSANRIAGDVRLDDFDKVDELLKGVPKERIIVAYCTCPDEGTSAHLAHALRNKGYRRSYALKGGYYGWLRVDGPIEQRK